MAKPAAARKSRRPIAARGQAGTLPKVETRTLHELAASDDNAALLKQLQLGQAADSLDNLGQTALHVAATNDKADNLENTTDLQGRYPRQDRKGKNRRAPPCLRAPAA